MRISDWSSDVCSSDLHRAYDQYRQARREDAGGRMDRRQPRSIAVGPVRTQHRDYGNGLRNFHQKPCWTGPSALLSRIRTFAGAVFRSEEHTSDLQSLMRLSYAGFHLKKTK